MSTISTLNFDSISKFAEAIKETLHDKAVAAVAAKSDEMKSNQVSEEREDDGELELSFDPSDLTEIVNIANETEIEYEVEEDEITITETNSDKIDAFLSALDEAGISYEEDDEEDLDEGAAKRRVHTSAQDKAKHKKAYRKNRGKIKIKAKKYRRTSKAKRLVKVGKRKAKQGKTATGRRVVTRV